jgi:hypothetical protein
VFLPVTDRHEAINYAVPGIVGILADLVFFKVYPNTGAIFLPVHCLQIRLASPDIGICSDGKWLAFRGYETIAGAILNDSPTRPVCRIMRFGSIFLFYDRKVIRIHAEIDHFVPRAMDVQNASAVSSDTYAGRKNGRGVRLKTHEFVLIPRIQPKAKDGQTDTYKSRNQDKYFVFSKEFKHKLIVANFHIVIELNKNVS